MKALTHIEHGKLALIAKPNPDMYGKNLTFKTGGVDGCNCAEILALIEAGKIDTTPSITHRDKLDDVIKIAVIPDQ